MNTIDKASLEKWLDELGRIIIDIKITTDNLNKLESPKDEFEREILDHGFFAHCYKQSRFTLIVQLSKLFSNSSNQKRSFIKLFNILENSNYNKELMELLENNSIEPNLFTSKKDVVEFISTSRIRISKKSELIEKVNTLRNEVYAHSDPDPSLPRLNIEELTELCDLSIQLYNNLRGKLFDIEFLFDLNDSWKIDYPIKMLATQLQDFRNKQINQISAKLGGNN